MVLLLADQLHDALNCAKVDFRRACCGPLSSHEGPSAVCKSGNRATNNGMLVLNKLTSDIKIQ